MQTKNQTHFYLKYQYFNFLEARLIIHIFKKKVNIKRYFLLMKDSKDK